MERSQRTCKILFSNQGLSIKIIKFESWESLIKKILILHEDHQFHMIMLNRNELTIFKHHYGGVGMVIQKSAWSCKIYSHYFLSCCINKLSSSFRMFMGNFAKTCETNTPLVSLHAILLNYSYIPCFIFELHIV